MIKKVPVNEEFKSEYALIYSDSKMEEPYIKFPPLDKWKDLKGENAELAQNFIKFNAYINTVLDFMAFIEFRLVDGFVAEKYFYHTAYVELLNQLDDHYTQARGQQKDIPTLEILLKKSGHRIHVLQKMVKGKFNQMLREFLKIGDNEGVTDEVADMIIKYYFMMRLDEELVSLLVKTVTG